MPIGPPPPTLVAAILQSFGETALHVSVASGGLGCVSAILAMEPSLELINATTPMGMTPFQYGVVKGAAFPVLQVLLDRGAALCNAVVGGGQHLLGALPPPLCCHKPPGWCSYCVCRTCVCAGV